MINLLPANEKTKVRKEYIFRVIAVATGLLSAVMMLVILSFMPPYFLAVSNNQVMVSESQSSEAISKKSQEQELASTVTDMNKKISALGNGSSTTAIAVGALFEDMIESKPEGVLITSVSFEKSISGSSKKSGAARLILQGKAKNRESLIAFKNKLDEQPYFESIDLPISNLVGGDAGVDLPYSITILIGQNKKQ